jgi:transposase
LERVSVVFEDFFDKKIGMITLKEKFEKVPNGKHFRYLVYFECDCGKSGYMCPRTAIKRRDCGCQAGTKRREKRKTHGRASERIYRTWNSMVSRCTNPKNSSYFRYGGRGISVCEKWRKFQGFYEDMGDKPYEGATLERIDNNGPYSKENCKWATMKEQCNNRRTNTIISINGKDHTLEQASIVLGLNRQTVSTRLSRGIPLDQALQEKSAPRKLNIDGRELTLMQAEREFGIKMKIISKRLKRGWGDIDAVTRLPRENGYKKTL